jgi:transposase
MASKRKKGTKKVAPLAPFNRRAAGVDIGSTFHVVAVPPELDAEPVRSFRSFTADLTALADWLVGLGVATVAMESTGIYWIPLFEILEARGLEVVVVNARDAKNVPGRKTDINDAQWIQQLHSYGLLRASFRLGAQIVALRAYLRHRERLIEYAASHVQHMQKALMQMNLQLHHVVTDITGVTGMRILREIVAGETDPDTLAAHRDVRCKASVETIRDALTGHHSSRRPPGRGARRHWSGRGGRRRRRCARRGGRRRRRCWSGRRRRSRRSRKVLGRVDGSLRTHVQVPLDPSQREW